MRCKNCDYALWNLKARQCPECGTPFRPSDFEFVVNSVRFCCPHCNQAYYGTGEKGHLVPTEFDCVTCGVRLGMDEMVLLPAEGVKEERTRVERVPWLERRQRGAVKAWFATVAKSLLTPYRLMRGLPEASSAGAAWWYAVLTTALFRATGLLSLFIVGAIIDTFVGGGNDAAGIVLFGGGIFLGWLAAEMILLALWGLVTHAMLRVTGGAEHSIGRTYQALCYSAGANAFGAVPCLGSYPFAFVGWTWWVVSAILMVATGQRVHGGRATLAVLTFPVLVVAVAGSYVAFMVVMFSNMGAFAAAGMAGPTTETQVVLDGVLDYASRHDGQGPGHALQLVSSPGLCENDFVTWAGGTSVDDVPAGDADLVAFMLLPPDDQAEVAEAAAEALPENVIAHRLGHFVFTHHGIDLNNADPGLWVVVQSPDPDVSPVRAPWGVFVVGRADGTVTTVAANQFAIRLEEQNTLRAANDLPPLPDRATVTHDAPAVMDADRSDE